MANATVAFLMLFAFVTCYEICSGNDEAENSMMISDDGLDGVDQLEDANPTKMTVTDRSVFSRMTAIKCSKGCLTQAKSLIANFKKKPNVEFSPEPSVCSLFSGDSKTTCSNDDNHSMAKMVGNALRIVFNNKPAELVIKPEDICGMTQSECQGKSKRISDWAQWKPEIPETKSLGASNPTAFGKQDKIILHLSANQQLIKEKYLTPISKEHENIQFIILTLDFSDGLDGQKKTIEEVMEGAGEAVKLVKETFPSAKIYPTIGSLDFFPMNDGDKEKTIYDKVYDEVLKPALLDDLKVDKGRYFGYYKVELADDVFLISINTNFCNTRYFWNVVNFTDPHGQLEWLSSFLSNIADGVMVYIVGHIAPGSKQCQGKWSEEYNKIVVNHSHRIVGQFFSNTRHDEFELMFARTTTSPKTSIPVAIAYLTPSLNQGKNGRPTYRIYLIDDSKKTIVDHETYTAETTASAEGDSEIQFTKIYSAKETLVKLEFKSLDPASWYGYVSRMATEVDGNSPLFEAYLMHYNCSKIKIKKTSNNFRSKKPKKTEEETRKKRLCDLVTSSSKIRATKSRQNKQCKKLMKMMQSGTEGTKNKKTRMGKLGNLFKRKKKNEDSEDNGDEKPKKRRFGWG